MKLVIGKLKPDILVKIIQKVELSPRCTFGNIATDLWLIIDENKHIIGSGVDNETTT